MNKKTQYQHWQLTPADGAHWLYFDRADKSTNSINPAVLTELAEILTHLAHQKDIQGLIIASAKANSFIMGADVEVFTHFSNEKDALAFIQQGQAVFQQLATLPFSTVALIKGFCLGGGLELALACRYRVACDDAKTQLGLPEILLGLHPGWGGSVRLPRLIGAPQALDLILTGRSVDGKTASKMGIVDVAVPERHLKAAALFYALKNPELHQANWLQTITNYPLIRPLLGKLLHKKVAAKVLPEHYPAPFAVLENWEKVGVEGQLPFKVEAESLSKIAMTETAHNLLRVFFLRERLKNLAKDTVFAPQHVHVIGAGTMGGDIAAWCALRGLRVTLQDREPKFIAPAMKRAYELYKRKLKSPRLIQAALDRLLPDPEGVGIAQADVIIEAIFEDLKAKQSLFKTIEAQCKPDAILATNTSSIPLDEIASVLRQPERLIGLHFFNPVAKMPLVEVVQGRASQAELISKALAFVRRLDKLPLPVSSSPGFLVNRILMPYLLDAITLSQEGVAIQDIDYAAVQFGMPMGPIELVDTVGLDICLAVGKKLVTYFDGVLPARLEKLVAEGKLGRKTGEGFYVYKNGKPVKKQVTIDAIKAASIADRLVRCMIREAEACLKEKVVADSDLLDAGMIFGTGFAPFRGGLMFYAKNTFSSRDTTR